MSPTGRARTRRTSNGNNLQNRSTQTARSDIERRADAPSSYTDPYTDSGRRAGLGQARKARYSGGDEVGDKLIHLFGDPRSVKCLANRAPLGLERRHATRLDVRRTLFRPGGGVYEGAVPCVSRVEQRDRQPPDLLVAVRTGLCSLRDCIGATSWVSAGLLRSDIRQDISFARPENCALAERIAVSPIPMAHSQATTCWGGRTTGATAWSHTRRVAICPAPHNATERRGGRGLSVVVYQEAPHRSGSACCLEVAFCGLGN